MKQKTVHVTCTIDGELRRFHLVAFDIRPADEDISFLALVLDNVRNMTATNLSPAGWKRDDSELRATRYLGAASELLLESYLQDVLGSVTKVSRDEFVDYTDHVDLTISNGSRIIQLEVRGSFPYSPLRSVVCRLFDIIGPYRTSYKQEEDPKDFYLRTLINIRQRDFDFHKPHTVYFAGGASYNLLEELGEYASFKQRGATYLAIKPIARARDAVEIVMDISQELSA